MPNNYYKHIIHVENKNTKTQKMKPSEKHVLELAARYITVFPPLKYLSRIFLSRANGRARVYGNVSRETLCCRLRLTI